MTIGIANVGNTCCINTCIQCIFHLGHLSNRIKNTKTFPANGVGSALQELLTFIETNAQDIVISPNRLIRTIHEHSNGLFPEGEQHDLCELWVWLLDKIHEESAVVYPQPPQTARNPLEQGVVTTLFRYQQGRYSSILNCTQGSQIALVMCNQCGYRVSNIEPFTVITLNMQCNSNETDSCESIIDLLQNYFTKDVLDDWKCDKCGHNGGTRMVKFYQVPQTLVIVLKRFQMNHQGQIKKINTRVSISNTLQFHPAAVISMLINTEKQEKTQSLRYKLKGLANHYGSYFGGHYTSSVSVDASEWKYVDDNAISDITDVEQHLDKNQSGYMLFYERG